MDTESFGHFPQEDLGSGEYSCRNVRLVYAPTLPSSELDARNESSKGLLRAKSAFAVLDLTARLRTSPYPRQEPCVL